MTTTADVKAGLLARYPAGANALLWEVGNGTGMHCRRHADAVAMGLYPSRGLEIDGIEIKVSRSDWQRELANPEKAEAVQQYCDRWWVAAPKGLVKREELPPTWGLMELLANGTLRATVPAPRLEPKPVDRTFLAALMRRTSEADDALVEILLQKKLKALRDEDKAKLEREIHSRCREAVSVMDRVKEVQEATGIDLLGWRADTPGIIAAIKFALGADLGKSYGLIDRIRQDVARLSKALDELGPPQEIES